MLDDGQGEVAGHPGVGGQPLLGPLDELAVVVLGVDDAPREVERFHHVLEHRSQQPRLVPLEGEVVDERDERAEEPVVAPQGGRRLGRARLPRRAGAESGLENAGSWRSRPSGIHAGSRWARILAGVGGAPVRAPFPGQRR